MIGVEMLVPHIEMISIDNSYLPNLLVTLRQQDPDISLVSSSGQVVPCHSSILSLLSPSLSSLLAQLPREKADQLAISLPVEYQDVLKLTDITADNLPKYDILKDFNNVLHKFEHHADTDFPKSEFGQQKSSSALTYVDRKKTETVLIQKDLNMTNEFATTKFKGIEHKSLNMDDDLTIKSKRNPQVSSTAEYRGLTTKKNSEFYKEKTANPKDSNKLSNILKEYECYLESDQPTSYTTMLDMSKSNDGNISKTTDKPINSKKDVNVGYNENCKSDGATNTKETQLL